MRSCLSRTAGSEFASQTEIGSRFVEEGQPVLFSAGNRFRKAQVDAFRNRLFPEFRRGNLGAPVSRQLGATVWAAAAPCRFFLHQLAGA